MYVSILQDKTRDNTLLSLPRSVISANMGLEDSCIRGVSSDSLSLASTPYHDQAAKLEDGIANFPELCDSSESDFDGEGELHHFFDRIYFAESSAAISKSVDETLVFLDVSALAEHTDCGIPVAQGPRPTKLAAAIRFCHSVNKMLDRHKSARILLTGQVQNDTYFFLGFYCLMTLHCDVALVKQRLEHVCLPNSSKIAAEECWGILHRAKELGWLDLRMDDPISSAFAAALVPGRVVGISGPKFALNVESLKQLKVRGLVLFSKDHYTKQVFEDCEIAVAELPYYADDTIPSGEEIAKFMAIVEGCPGKIAVLCKDGQRIGTMVALYLMKDHGFTAHQASGWLRLVQPDIVSSLAHGGRQQQFLSQKEALIVRCGSVDELRRRLPDPTSAAAVKLFIADSLAAVDEMVQQFNAKATRTTSAPAALKEDLQDAARLGIDQKCHPAALASLAAACPSNVREELQVQPRPEVRVPRINVSHGGITPYVKLPTLPPCFVILSHHLCPSKSLLACRPPSPCQCAAG